MVRKSKPEPARPCDKRRLYEWRDGKGLLYDRPRLADNACAFRIWSIANGIVVKNDPPPPNAPPVPKDPSKSLYVYVTSTSEKVNTEVSACRTRARLEEGFPWFNASGRQVSQ